MNTKSIPAFIMLLAGAVASILGLINQYETTEFIIMILIVLLVFYIIGGIVKIIVDKNFKGMDEQVQDEQKESEEAKENIESAERTKADE